MHIFHWEAIKTQTIVGGNETMFNFFSFSTVIEESNWTSDKYYALDISTFKWYYVFFLEKYVLYDLTEDNVNSKLS